MTSASNSLRRARPLLGTFVEIALEGAPRAAMNAAADAAFAAIAEVHRLMSPVEPMSDVARVNRQAASHAVRVHPWTYAVLEAALELHRRSAGLFDVSAHAGSAPPPLKGREGRGVMLATRRAGPPTCPRPDGLGRPPPQGRRGDLELLPNLRVRFIRPGLAIDLGGIAKGFAVDRAVAALKARGVPRGLVNAGGDLAAFGAEAFPVHLRDPRRLLCRIALADAALASSGAAADAPAAAAIIDPRSGRAAPRARAASVRASSCMLADALTKVVTIAGEAAASLLNHFGASAIFAEAGAISVTPDWQEEVALVA